MDAKSASDLKSIELLDAKKREDERHEHIMEELAFMAKHNIIIFDRMDRRENKYATKYKK